MALSIPGHIDAALIQIGRAGDLTLRSFAVNRWTEAFYNEINRVRKGESLNCSRVSQSVNMTGAHNGILTLQTDFKETNEMSVVDGATVPSNVYYLDYDDYYVLERQFPPGSPRSTPQYYAWKRTGPNTGTIAPGDAYEIFPKPDRALTLNHDYYRWLQPPPSTSLDLILNQWGEMFAEYLLYKMLASLGEHADAAKHQEEYEKEKARFNDWDESLYGGRQNKMRTKQRDGTEDMPFFQ